MPRDIICCTACRKTEGPLHRCKGCYEVQYCSRKCQKKGWKTHKQQCKKLPKGNAANQPCDRFALARFVPNPFDKMLPEDVNEATHVLKMFLHMATGVKEACVVCHKLVGTKVCETCKNVYYCSKVCQRKDWPSHQYKCRSITVSLCFGWFFSASKWSKNTNKISFFIMYFFCILISCVELKL